MKGLLILLGIGKWLGIALLVLLFLLLLLFAVVLLSPIRYRLAGEKKTEIGGSFGVRWLFGALRVKGHFGEGEEPELRVEFLWFTLLGEKPQKKKKRRKKREKAEKPAKQTEQPAPSAPAAQVPDLAAAEKTTPESKPKPERKPEPTRQPKTMRRVKFSEIEEKLPEVDTLWDDEDAADGFFTGEDAAESSEYTEKNEKIPPVCKILWRKADKRGIFRALRKFLGRILRGVLPGQFQLKGKFGLGDPALTGELLGVFGIAQAKYGNAIQIRGDFAKIAAEDIEIKLEGKIRLGSLLFAALAFLLAKPVRQAVQLLWKERKAQKGQGEQ